MVLTYVDSNWQEVNISSGNGLVLNGQQAISLTNDDPDY